MRKHMECRRGAAADLPHGSHRGIQLPLVGYSFLGPLSLLLDMAELYGFLLADLHGFPTGRAPERCRRAASLACGGAQRRTC